MNSEVSVNTIYDKKNMLISVIIPVYNVEQYLDRCIRSVVDQTYSNIEIILVDDGSPDDCPAKCEEWARNDLRIRVIHKENGGVSSARNIGLAASNGEFIFFLDSDDIIHPQAFELLVKCQQQYQADYVIAKHLFKYSEEWYSEQIQYDTNQTKGLNTRGFLAEQFEKMCVTGHLINKDLIGDTLFPNDISLGEDSVFNYSLLQKNDICFSLLDIPLYCYCYRNNSAAANRRGFEGYYLTAEWCNKNLDFYNEMTKGYIIKEALKKSFLYRFEFYNNKGKYNKENKSLIHELLAECMKDPYISLKEKIVYVIMSVFPSSYRLYVNNRNKS